MWTKILSFLNIVKFFRERSEKKKQEEQLAKRLEELRKRDPFIYKSLKKLLPSVAVLPTGMALTTMTVGPLCWARS